MARTWAQANTERLRLLALGRRLQVKVVKNPLLGNDGAVWPGGAAVNDYMLLVKDPRPTGGSLGEGANQATHWTSRFALAIGRWHGGAAEHASRLGAGVDGGGENSLVGPYVGWKLYGAGETREAGQIPDSAVVFA